MGWKNNNENQYELLSALVTVSAVILIYFPSYNLRETGQAGKMKEMKYYKLFPLQYQILEQISQYSVQNQDQVSLSFNNFLSLVFPYGFDNGLLLFIYCLKNIPYPKTGIQRPLVWLSNFVLLS